MVLKKPIKSRLRSRRVSARKTSVVTLSSQPPRSTIISSDKRSLRNTLPINHHHHCLRSSLRITPSCLRFVTDKLRSTATTTLHRLAQVSTAPQFCIKQCTSPLRHHHLRPLQLVREAKVERSKIIRPIRCSLSSTHPWTRQATIWAARAPPNYRMLWQAENGGEVMFQLLFSRLLICSPNV